MAESETRSCQSCKVEFTIAPEDFAFYQKIEVPPPTWCPDCRAQRRMAWRNEWRVFRKPDARNGQEVFSNFSPQSPLKVYQPDDWYGDNWDPMKYGRDYDFTRPFFEQFIELLHEVPVPSRIIVDIVNSDYCINLGWTKNCYLVAAANFTEDSAYLISDTHSRDCFDCRMTNGCELCYDGLNLVNCYRTFFSQNCEGCRNVLYSKDLIGCSDCFGCVNLRNKQYHIWNKPYSKEAYEEKLAELGLHSWKNHEDLRRRAREFWIEHPNKATEASSNEQVSGEYVYESKNVVAGWNCRGLEDSKYCQNVYEKSSKECYDHTNWGLGAELICECLQVGKQSYNIRYCWASWGNNRNLQYSMFCMGSSDLFGCVSLRKQQHCILNKRYSKEEYEALVPKVIQHMKEMPYTDRLGREYRYGEFFPAELSPSEYNVTIAQEHFPLTKEEATKAGYSWYDQPNRDVAVQLASDQMPDNITKITPDLVGKIIGCAHKGTCDDECTSAFTIIAQELAFLMEQGLPLPRLCPNCRHYWRIKQRRGMRLHERQCQCHGQHSSNGVYANISTAHGSHSTDQPCPNEFETSFAPDRPDIVYCEVCYQAEVV